jgi:CheY-like chemotaxis protein
MQMVDGFESTRLIRAFEQQNSTHTRPREKYGRIPIFAVSGGLMQKDEDRYVASHFDGWMPKPIDPTKLSLYLLGAVDKAKRMEGLYGKDKFDDGGWFRQVIESVMLLIR